MLIKLNGKDFLIDLFVTLALKEKKRRRSRPRDEKRMSNI
jgi:hypothetical protein